FDCYLISVFDGEDAWAGHPKDFNWEALEGATLVSHNKGFDEAVYNRLVELGIAPKVKIANWYCSANFTSFRCNRRPLDQSVTYLFKTSVPKGMRDWMNKRHWEDAVRE